MITSGPRWSSGHDGVRAATTPEGGLHGHGDDATGISARGGGELGGFAGGGSARWGGGGRNPGPELPGGVGRRAPRPGPPLAQTEERGGGGGAPRGRPPARAQRDDAAPPGRPTS